MWIGAIAPYKKKIEAADITNSKKMTAFKGELEQYRDRWDTVEPYVEPDEICPLIETVPLGE